MTEENLIMTPPVKLLFAKGEISVNPIKKFIVG